MPAGGMLSAEMLGGLAGSGGAGGMKDMIGKTGNALPSAAISLGTSLIQNLQANKLKKRADASMPSAVDPRQASFLAELNQKRKSIETGADNAAGMDAINSTAAGTQSAILNAAGGDVGGAMQGLLAAQRGADTAKGNVIAQGQGQQMAYNSMFNQLNDKIAARQLQLQMQKSQQARAEWAQKKQTANQNLMAGIGNAASILSGVGGGQQGSSPASTPLQPENMASLTPPSLPGSAEPELKPDASFLNNLAGR